MYSCSLFLISEVYLLLNVVHSSLLSVELFFSYANKFGFNRYGNLFLYLFFLQGNSFEKCL